MDPDEMRRRVAMRLFPDMVKEAVARGAAMTVDEAAGRIADAVEGDIILQEMGENHLDYLDTRVLAAEVLRDGTRAAERELERRLGGG